MSASATQGGHNKYQIMSGRMNKAQKKQKLAYSKFKLKQINVCTAQRKTI